MNVHVLNFFRFLYVDRNSLNKMIHLYLFQPILLNNTIKATSEVLYFNRATKVGSLALTKLLYVYLDKKNGFKVRFDSQDKAADGKLSLEEQVLHLHNFV